MIIKHYAVKIHTWCNIKISVYLTLALRAGSQWGLSPSLRQAAEWVLRPASDVTLKSAALTKNQTLAHHLSCHKILP